MKKTIWYTYNSLFLLTLTLAPQLSSGIPAGEDVLCAKVTMLSVVTKERPHI